MRHLIVVSDLHLWQATDHDDLWMRYRHRRFLPDEQFAELVTLLCDTIPVGSLELVLNGDIFDFDIPEVVAGQAVASRSPRREAEAVRRLSLILADHGSFITSLARLLCRGHRVIFVAGNHDLQLNFKLVQRLLRERIEQELWRLQGGAPRASELSRQLEFHAWFYRSASGAHIEHGNQYDPYCSVPDPEWPFHVDGSLHTNVGALALEHLVGRLGYFNPNVDSTFLLTTREYIEHWLRYYLRSPRSLIGTWFLGSLRVLLALWRTQGVLGSFPRCVEVQSEEEAAHTALFARAELRAALHLFGVAGVLTLLLCLLSIALFVLWKPLGVAAILLTLLFDRLLQPRKATDLGSVVTQVNGTAQHIARIYGARAVIFGHTHQPEGRWERGVFYGNSGTWVPMYQDVACNILIEESRPLIWLRDEAGTLTGGLCRFHGGTLYPSASAQQSVPFLPSITPTPPPHTTNERPSSGNKLSLRSK